MEEAIGKLETRELDAESAAETYDREFLDRKGEMPDPFVKDKFYTLQDKTLYFFWIAYALLSTTIVVVTFVQTKSAKSALYNLAYALVAGALRVGLIFRFA